MHQHLKDLQDFFADNRGQHHEMQDHRGPGGGGVLFRTAMNEIVEVRIGDRNAFLGPEPFPDSRDGLPLQMLLHDLRFQRRRFRTVRSP